VSDQPARLFVALELPQAARDALLGWREHALAGVSGLRLVAPDALHVTLCFLGSRREAEIGAIGDACATVAPLAPGPLAFGDAVWLPARGPRVLAVEVEDRSGGLARAQAALSDALQAGGWYAPEARAFLAHVTIARVVKGARPRPKELTPTPTVAFDGAQITLYRSRLGAGGARYESLRTVSLGSSAPPPVDPLTVVTRFHAEQARVYAGDELESLREQLTDDVVWHVPGASRIAGEHRGVDAVLAYFQLRRTITDATFRVTVHGLAAVGDRIVQLAGGRAERDGNAISWETVGVFRVAEGRVAECWLVPFDLYQFDELWR
jgi:RNA 2',3'-cyclic 3'-phosphodiesterase